MRRAVSLSGAAFALLCIVLILFVLPAGAQDDGGIPPGTPANGVDTLNNNRPPDVILVAADDCTVSPGASITLEDGDGTQATFTDGEKGITISDQNGRPKIVGPTRDFVGDDSHVTFPSHDDTSFDTDKHYSVVSSTGITGCRGGSASPAQDQYGAVDNPKGVVSDTATKKKMPSTGGPPYITVAALVLLSAAVIVGHGVLRP
jgi:hypothetical protein